MRRRGRTALTAAGVAIGVGLIVALLSIAAGVHNTANDLIHVGRADFGLFQKDVTDLTKSLLPDTLENQIDRKPGVLAPAYGTIERYRLNEWLNFIATEIHKQFGPLWHAETPEATKATQRALLGKRFDLVEKTLAKQPYLSGSTFTIADAYLFTVVSWSGTLGGDLTPWPALREFQARVAARPRVYAALKAEHLVKDSAPASV